jgi:hypothetical protein
VTVSVKYSAVLGARRETVIFLSSLLYANRRVIGTRAGTRALGCFARAVPPREVPDDPMRAWHSTDTARTELEKVDHRIAPSRLTYPP